MTPLPELRDDLIFKAQKVSNITTYICKDPVKQAYYRFNEEEYFVLASLKEASDLQSIADAYNKKFNDELSAAEVRDFLSALAKKEIFRRDTSEQNTYLIEQLKEQRRKKILQSKGSLMYFRVKIWDPDRFFNAVMPKIHWLWSKQSIRILNIFMLLGLVALLANLHQVRTGIAHIFDFGSKTLFSIVLLWATVMGTIMIHELGHGLTCKRFGGECHEIGFLFMFFMPCMYANVNDAWMFDNKRHRLYVTFAGCYAEMLFGFICVFVWLLTQPGSLFNLLSFQIVVVAFFSAIFMNFNPLMKFDGYFALSDYLEIPNLRNRSQSFVKYVFQKHVFRLERECDDYLTQREQVIFFIYGILVVIYLTNVFSGIGFMFGSILIGKFGMYAGILLTLLLLYKILGIYMKKTFGFFKIFFREKAYFFRRKPIRIIMVSAGLALGALFTFVPFSSYLTFTTTLEPAEKIQMRSKASGFIQSISGRNTPTFKTGDSIFILNNTQLENDYKNSIIEYRQNDLHLQNAYLENNPLNILKYGAARIKLLNRKSDLERQLGNLILRAPFEGIFENMLITDDNRFISRGDTIGLYLNPDRFIATVDILEREMENIAIGSAATLLFDVHPGMINRGAISEIASLPVKEGAARKYRVNVSFPNSNNLFYSGISGTVSLHTGKATSLQRVIRAIRKTIRLDLQI